MHMDVYDITHLETPLYFHGRKGEALADNIY